MPSCLFSGCLSALTAAAAIYDVDWTRLSSGTVLSQTAGPYEISATAGQPDAGEISGCALSVQGGFWVIGAPPEIPSGDGDEADLSVSIQESADPVAAGAAVIFTVSVRNQGPATASGVALRCALPSGAGLVSVASSRRIGIDGAQLICEAGSIGVGACAEVQLALRLPAGLHHFSASATGAQADRCPADNFATEATSAIPGAQRSFTWTAAASRDWHDPRNWRPSISNPPWTPTNGPPELGDTAIVPYGVPDLELSRDAMVGRLLLDGDLSTSNTLTVAIEGQWSRGTVAGIGSPIRPGTIAIAPGARFELNGSFGTVLSGFQIVNRGRIVWSGGGSLDWNSATLENARGATFEIRTVAASRNFTVINEGLLIKESGAQTFDFVLDNRGCFEARTGPIQWDNAVTNRGRINLLPNVVLNLNQGGSIGGEVEIGPGALLDFRGSGEVRDARLFGSGLARLPGSGAGNTLTVIGKVSADHFAMSGGNLNGSGTLSINQAMSWTGGFVYMNDGLLAIPSGVLLTIDGAGEKRLGSTLDNSGTIHWNGAGQWTGFSGPVINNLPGGVIDARSDAPLTRFNEAATLNNAGLFRKSGPGAKTIELIVNNHGRFEATAGSLTETAKFHNYGTVELAGGTTVTLSGGTNSGAFKLGEAARLVLTSGAGTHHFQKGAMVSGPGLAELAGQNAVAEIAADTRIPISNFAMSSGQLQGAGTLTIAESMRWTGGFIYMIDGSLTIPSGAELTIDGASLKRLGSRLNNSGTVNWLGAGALSSFSEESIINNLPGGTFNVLSEAPLQRFSFAAVINNAGLFRCDGGFGAKEIEAAFNNSGKVELARGILRLTGGFNNTAGGVFQPGIAGKTAGTGYGQLAIAGIASLNGKLIPALAGGFQPRLNDRFQIIAATRREGEFASTESPLLNDGLEFLAEYAPAGVSLVATNAPPRPPILLRLERLGGKLFLSWPAAPPGVRIEFSDDLGTAPWNELAPLDAPPLPVAPTNRHRFFRAIAR